MTKLLEEAITRIKKLPESQQDEYANMILEKLEVQKGDFWDELDDILEECQVSTAPKNEIIFPTGEFWSDEPQWETYPHSQQVILLIKCLEWLWRDRKDYFVAGNLTIYYSRNQKKSTDFPGPDVFVVLGTNDNPKRRSWVVWQEDGKYPNVIFEIISESTAKLDKEAKKQVYQDIFRTPDYFWFDPFSLEFEGFTLISGTYQPIQPNEKGLLWSGQLGLYLGVYKDQLRYFHHDGELVLTVEEELLQKKEQDKLALQKIEELKAKLRELGINPDETL